MNKVIKNPFERLQKGIVVALCFVLVGFFSSCAEKKENNVNEDCLSVLNIVHDKSSSILGKWKLIKVRVNFASSAQEIKCTDYSQYNIVFEFKSNNVLTISAETEHPEIWTTGEHFYSIVDEEMFGNSTSMLQINTLYECYQINSKELIITGAPVDGPSYYLVKIN